MAIPQTKYVNIISSVGGTSQVSQRDLIGRVFTNNDLVPYGVVLEFAGLDSVGNYFGLGSNEYAFAKNYFAYQSKSGNKPQKISFALHTTTDKPARLYGAVKATTLAELTTYTNEDISFNIGGQTYDLIGLDFSSETSLSGVATTIAAALNEESATAGIFTYDATLQRFVLESQATGAEATIGYATGNLAEVLGMNEGNLGAIISDGSDVETGLKVLTDTTALTNNFLSFCFLIDVSGEEEDIGAWVKAQNVRYMWSLGVARTDAGTMAGKLSTYDGVAINLGTDLVFLPMAVASAINYDLPNASVDFMFQQADGITTTVVDETEQEAYDAIRVNYYGGTQQAGNLVFFYQDGKLQGSIAGMGVYVNEAWLKDALFTNILNLRLSLDSLPANETGLAYVKGAIQEIIEKAQNNGVISAGKTLDSTQKAYINQITGDKTAWQSIQSIGYWMTASIVKYTEAGTEKYKVSFLLVYSKGDSINYVDGKDILI